MSGLLLGLCRQARADLRRMRRQPGPAVHALRVRMKKLRALLRFAEAVAAPADLAAALAELRLIRRAFGARRDDEVAYALAMKLAHRHGLPLPGLADDATAVLVRDPVRVSRRALDRLEQRLRRLPLAAVTLAGMRSAYARQYRRCRRLWRRCGKQPDAAGLHAWRRRVKELHHLSLILNALPAARRRVRPARELGRRLGQLQDLRVLAMRLPAAAGRDWRRVLNRRRKLLLERAFAVAAPLLRPAARDLWRS